MVEAASFTHTFLQKPEKRTWLDWSLFFSSLETWRNAELVRGESLACKNQLGQGHQLGQLEHFSAQFPEGSLLQPFTREGGSVSN